MNAVARINIWGNFAGAVAWDDKNGNAVFEFDSGFLKKGLDISPLIMPVGNPDAKGNKYSFPNLNAETYKGLPGLLADSLPDKFGTAVIAAWLARQGRGISGFNSVEHLCYLGKRGMGALEYEPAFKDFESPSNPVVIEELVKIAGEILKEKKGLKTNIHKDASNGLLDIIRVGTSAGGARAKAIIAYNPVTGDVKSGQIDGLRDFEYWIIKFDGVEDKELLNPKGYGKIEYAYYLMAIECGIKMSGCRLLNENGRAHFMTKRFDRLGSEKLHMQTLCGLAHYDYNDPYSYSYEQAFQVMRQMKLSYTEMEEMYRRMVFNVVARNQDDHTKNISFLMDEKSVWRLSPAYDLTYAYDPENKWLKAHQMSVNGKREDIDKQDLLAFAKNMNIKKGKDIIEKIIETVSRWRSFAEKAGVNPAQIKAVEKTHLINL